LREASGNPRLGGIAEERGDAGASLAFYEQALAIYRESRSPAGIANTLVSLGRLHMANGRKGEAQACLDEASVQGDQLGDHSTVVVSHCLLAVHSDTHAADALSAFREHCELLEHADRVAALFRLWKVTQDAAHLTEAKRLLDYRVEHAPEEYRESMLKNVRLNREIMEAWAEHRETAGKEAVE